MANENIENLVFQVIIIDKPHTSLRKLDNNDKVPKSTAERIISGIVV